MMTKAVKIRKNYRLSPDTVQQLEHLLKKKNDEAKMYKGSSAIPWSEWTETSLIEALIYKEYQAQIGSEKHSE